MNEFFIIKAILCVVIILISFCMVMTLKQIRKGSSRFTQIIIALCILVIVLLAIMFVCFRDVIAEMFSKTAYLY